MTDPNLLDPVKNAAYYRTCDRYRDNPDRLQEPRVRWIIEHVPKAGRVLDLACNDGFLAQLMPDGVEYSGVELNPRAVAAAYPKARGRIVQGDITQLRLDPGVWDCILVCEVLEHLTDPGAVLRGLRPALAPGGRLLTTSALGRGHGYEPGNAEHLVEWNPPGYRRLHEEAGFVVKEQVLARVYGERFTNAVHAEPA